jgi:hypothetical protein
MEDYYRIRDKSKAEKHSFLQSHNNPVFPNQKKKLVPNPP